MPIIKNPHERTVRAQEKKEKLLHFLRDEIYTTPTIAALLLGVGERATRQTISTMEKSGLVRRHPVRLMQHLPPVVVFGITPHGQGLAFDPDIGEAPVSRYFDPGKYSLLQLQHTIDMQRLRVLTENSGLIEGWLPGAALGTRRKGSKNPDAVLTTTSGIRVAVEVERTIKNAKRYKAILRDHLDAISNLRWHATVWVSPNMDISHRVEALVLPKNNIHENGVIDLLVERHRIKLFFTDYSSFVDCLRDTQSLYLPGM